MDSTNTTEPAVHEALKNISWLIGRWKGTGSGKYPTIQSFSYDQELVFGHCGNPFLSYQSNSWHSETKAPMHSESGFVRVHPETNKVAFVTAHNTGIATIEEGDGNENELNLSSNSVQRISFAKAPQVIKVKRSYQLKSPTVMEMTFDMETDNTQLEQHLEATFNKVQEK